MKAKWLSPNSMPLFAPLSAILIAAFVGSSSVQAKDHVDLQFWDMIWGPPEYIDTGKALVTQFNQEHSVLPIGLFPGRTGIKPF